MHYQYKTKNTCSQLIDFDIEDDKITLYQNAFDYIE